MNDADEYRNWSYREIECVNSASTTFNPHDHQREAWRQLDRADTPRRALLVLPTGAGKTHTAVSWLMKNVLSEPSERPILWIAHRAELLQQAAKTFNELRCLARRKNPLKLRCISGAHGKPITALLKPVDISLCTIQSMSTQKGQDVVRAFFEKNKHCVIVIDEAHHAAAQSYRNAVSPVLRRRNVEILGLTATPTRTIKAEVDRLKRIFSQGIVYQIDQPTLIERGILSRPICSTVRTGLNFDRHLTIKELKFLKTFGDLPESILHKIASHGPRNKLIVNHYLQHRQTFGQTLVFATGIGHCYALAKHFKDKGISADYVASVRNDRSTNEEVVERFRRKKIDVLINVMLLTEGVDLPNTESVFLARPTSSEILMRQMVGRGMRGPKAGGGAEVRIVSFCGSLGTIYRLA